MKGKTCLEILIVFIIILVQLDEVLGQLLGTFELVHVNEGVVRGNSLVFFLSRPHYYGKYPPAGGYFSFNMYIKPAEFQLWQGP